MNTCPKCGMVKGMHASILPGCKCPWTPQETDCYGDGNVYRGVRSKDSFNPDWNTEAVLVEEMQRMAKRIEELEALAQTDQEPAIGNIRALKHRIHALEGELLGYKKIVSDQDAMLERQTARIVDLQTHIENFDGEDR